MSEALEQAILDTVRYFDLFQMPVTAVQVWRCLIISHTQLATKRVALKDIRTALATSAYLQQRLGTCWGYYFLAGKQQLVRERLRRHNLAQDKWKILRRVVRWLALVPFVKAVAGSGSLAIDNTKNSSDLDLFIIVKAGRIWTARLLLLLVAQLTGRRRKYWNVEAPNKICLNHYVTDNTSPLSDDVANLYTAVQYTLHVPMYGFQQLVRFRQVNDGWIKKYVLAVPLPMAGHGYEIEPDHSLTTAKECMQNFLLEPIGNWLEEWAERAQRFTINRHQPLARSGRVVMNNGELAFHPDTKVPVILRSFENKVSI